MVPNGEHQAEAASPKEHQWSQGAVSDNWAMSTTWDMQLDSPGEPGQARAVDQTVVQCS